MFKFMYILMLSITLSHADAMKSDSAHKKKEDYISTLTYAQMKKMDQFTKPKSNNKQKIK